MQQETLDLGVINDQTDVVVGVDEVGRGPLVGDVVAAAVILPNDCKLPLADSKKLSGTKRQFLAQQIQEQALSYALGRATPEEIDQYNILQATMLAMQRAVLGLTIHYDVVWVDGNRCPNFDCPCQAIVKGDGLVASISAASILAKVARDKDMIQLDRQYPDYGFAAHKGYPTAQHLSALAKYGLPDPSLYRNTFKPVKALLKTRS